MWISSAFAAVALMWVGAWLAAGSGIPKNTTLLGQDIGGLSNQAIEKLFASQSIKLKNSKITITVDGRKFERTRNELGIYLDSEATLNQIRPRSWNPISLFQTLTSGKNYLPIYSFSESALKQSLTDIANETDDEPVQGNIVFQGTRPIVIPSAAGKTFQIEPAMSEIKKKLSDENSFKFAAEIVEPTITTAEAKVALKSAVAATREPITLIVDNHPIKLKTSDIAYSLTFVPDSTGNLKPRFSADLLTQVLGLRWSKFVVAPVNARFTLFNGIPKLQPSVRGRGVTDDDLTAALVPTFSLTGVARSAVISTTELEPKITTEMAGGLGITEVVSTFTTKYPPAAYRIQNIHRAADLIDGTVLKPGELFSLNRIVGERTAANGFAEGIIINRGRFEKDFGGGVSQVATTAWNAAWFAGLELVNHMAHSFYISRYPAGRESTVAWPKVDMQFRNNLDSPIMIDASYTNSTLTIAIYGKKKFEVDTITGERRNIRAFEILDDDSPTCIHQDGVEGFDISVTRVVKLNGTEVERKTFATHYTPEDRITCTNPEAVFGNPPPPKPKKTPTPKVSIDTSTSTTPVPAQ